MPKVTFYHYSGTHHLPEYGSSRHLGWTPQTLAAYGRLVRPIIAEAFSFGDVVLTEDDIDWVPTAWPLGTVTTAVCSFEIETFGYAGRIEKLTKARLIKLKEDFVDIMNQAAFVPEPEDRKFFQIDGTKPLLWPKYLMPGGHHV